MTVVVQLPEQLSVEQPVRFATGGMADLYRAHRHFFHGGRIDLVVKHMFPDYNEDPTLVARFRDEARLGLQLRHSNVVTVLEYHLVEGHHYMVMEYLEGIDLAEILRRSNLLHEPLPQEVVASFLFGMASALSYLADARDASGQLLGLVHRDISPSNVLVTSLGTVKLIDFGVARAAAREARTETGALVGKYMYMSPELIQGQELDSRSDLFALGAVAYELLAGERAFAGMSEFESCDRILNADPRPLLELRPDADPLLVELVGRCLAKEPDDRYDHPHELVEKLYLYMHRHVAEPLPLLTNHFLEGLDRRWEQAKKAGTIGRPTLGRETATLPQPPPPTAVLPEPPPAAEIEEPPAPPVEASLEARQARIEQQEQPVEDPPQDDERAAAVAPVDDLADWPSRRRPRVLLAIAAAVAAILLIALGAVVVRGVLPATTPAGTPDGIAAGDRDGPGPGGGAARDGLQPGGRDPAAVAGDPGAHPGGPSAASRAGDPAGGTQPQSGDGAITDPGAAGGRGPRTRMPIEDDPAAAVAGGPEAFIDIQSHPWADVYLDGHRIGRTPLRNHAIPAGSHELTYRNTENGWSSRESVELEPGEVLTRTLDARPR